MSLIGYARVSTEDQSTDAQIDVLKVAGCAEIFREHMSGAKASRPELAKVLARVRRGDVLVVVRLDRLARSLSHLLSVIAELDAKNAHFKSLADPIDTTTPQGRFALQVLGAVAELERALIQERTKDGLRAAKKRGRVGGNPKLRAGDRDAIKQIVDAKAQAYFERVNRTAEHWLPIVKEMRPDHRWQDVVRVLNAKRERSNGPPPMERRAVETRGQTLRRRWPRRSSLAPARGAQVQQRTARDARSRRQARQSGADSGADRRTVRGYV